MRRLSLVCNILRNNTKQNQYPSIILFCVFLLSGCVSKPPEEVKRGLMIYKSSNITGYDNKQVIVDYTFVPYMNRINNYAKNNNVTLFVTSSFRKTNQHLTGTIVPPSKRSNHLAGHAIDMNIFFNDVLYESKNMNKSNWSTLPVNVKNFLNQIRGDSTLSWGGDFKIEDSVHIDDQLYEKNPTLWQELYDTYQ